MQEKIIRFCKRWIASFEDESTSQYELLSDSGFGDACRELGFVMDCGKSFCEKYPQLSFRSEDADLVEQAAQIDDLQLLGNNLFSQWRYYNHWAYDGSEICLPENRRWFVVALKRLMQLAEEDNQMQEVYEFLKKCGTYYLATVEGDQPRVRPFGTVDLFEGKLYIQTGKVKEVSRQIAANPKVEICAFADGQWLRLAGKLVADERVEAKQHMLDAYPSLQGMYSATDDNTQVLYFEDATATFSSFGGEPKVVKF